MFAPTTAEQCRQILELGRREGARIHPVGVGHSPSDLACTNGWLVRTEGLSGLIKCDPSKRTATFYAGTVLHHVHSALAEQSPPMALPNIGSISDQTLGGLISTASHGSGVDYPVLSAHVKSLLIALPQPGAPVVRVSRDQDPDLFIASLCGLGATGFLLEVEMDIEPAFRLRETKEAVDVDEVIDNLDIIKRSAQHVRVWWYYNGKGMIVGRANRTYQAAQPYGSWLDVLLGFHVTQFLLLIARYFRNFTPYVGKYVWWLSKNGGEVVNDGYKVLNFDCLFPQYTMEWAIPAASAQSCLREIRDWIDAEAADPQGLRVHWPIEIRWTSGDDIWLSPSEGEETCWIGVVTYRPYGLAVPYRKFHARFAEILSKYEGRPHWAKEHNLRPKQISALYPNFDKFRDVVKRVDPDGIMRSEYVRRHFEGEEVSQRIFKERPE